ncbi:hypothetical protein [Novosphingobium album (ex Liu et al. 2023)]|uniref:RiboL-PSP-HEPN domain-containing protein n=1 Tax=Novosphingobium album (ex Liu et al. 2023) TaxID=3031130 RepID=A0ABT5WVI4_9SPHN|nr:hypothetical protein [Novosphingobium album (ex Liu et al. 2023)]MDE8653893.1 hypothetical protein [Novosphingobium album (ex Liu et al. 2023)]
MLVTGLAKAGAHEKLAGYFDISVELQRRIGTFILLFSMIEQQLEFMLLQRNPPGPDRVFATDKMPVSDRLKAVWALAANEPEIAPDLILAADLGDLLAEVRHTVAHGAPIASEKLEKNRSWFGEPRKRPFAAVTLSEPALDAAATASEILFRLVSAIGARLAGEREMAGLLTPPESDMQALQSASATIRVAVSRSADGFS